MGAVFVEEIRTEKDTLVAQSAKVAALPGLLLCQYLCSGAEPIRFLQTVFCYCGEHHEVRAAQHEDLSLGRQNENRYGNRIHDR